MLGRRWWNLKLDRQFESDDLRWVLTDAGFVDVDIHTNPLRSSNFGRVDSMFASARRPAGA